MVKKCGSFWSVLMTLPSVSLKIIASASVHMRLEALGVSCVGIS